MGRFARLQKASQYNGRLVKVGAQRADSLFETVRPGSGDRLAVRAENLRGLLEKYASHESGDELAFDDGDLLLLGYDPVEAFWACKKGNMYCWVPVRNFQ